MRPLFEQYPFESPIHDYIYLPIYDIIFDLKPNKRMLKIGLALEDPLITQINQMDESIVFALIDQLEQYNKYIL